MQKPLAGIKVLSFEIQVAGPYCSMMLADQGATVVKVEQPGSVTRLAAARRGSRTTRGETQSGYFLRFNRNKRSLTLNLKSEAGRQVFRDLAASSDVLIENFRPGLLNEMGLGYDDLSRDNPGLVYASISGFGSMEGYLGPYSKRPAYDIVAQAMGGLMTTCGQAGGPPTWLGVALGDIASGMNAAYAIMLALFQRTQTGRGQYIDVSMYDTIIGLAERSVTAYSLTGHGPRARTRAVHGAVGAVRVQRRLGRPDRRDRARLGPLLRGHRAPGPRSATRARRRARSGRSSMTGWLGEIIAAWFRGQTKAEATETLLAAGLPVGPVQDAREIFDVPARRGAATC